MFRFRVLVLVVALYYLKKRAHHWSSVAYYQYLWQSATYTDHRTGLTSKTLRAITPGACCLLYDLGFSFFSFHSAERPTPETLTTLNRTPGISPLALPLRPKPASSTSSFSSTKFRQPSFGTASSQCPSFNSLERLLWRLSWYAPKAVTFLPFLMSCTRTHFRMAEFGCLASTPTFSSTMPFACEEPCYAMSVHVPVACVWPFIPCADLPMSSIPYCVPPLACFNPKDIEEIRTPNGDDLYAVPSSLFL